MRQQKHISRLILGGRPQTKIQRYIGEPFQFEEEELVGFLKFNGLIDSESHYVDAGVFYHDYKLSNNTKFGTEAPDGPRG